MAKIIFPNGAELEVIPSNGTDFSLKELSAIVGGYIETVPTKDGQIMVVNEEGKIHHLSPNPKATELLKYPDFIVGNALVCDTSMIK